MNGKECGRNRSWPTFKIISQYSHGETEYNHENLSQDTRPRDRDLDPGPSEDEAGVLTTRPRRSVCKPSHYIILTKAVTSYLAVVPIICIQGHLSH
jgi:hypothetical protein